MTQSVTSASPTAGAGRAPRTTGPDDAATRPVTSPHALRFCAVASYAAVLCTWIRTVGIPTDPVQLLIWTWLATVAWRLGSGWRTHVRFVRDWWLPATLLVAYTYAEDVADRLGMPVHTMAPIRVGEWLGHGRTATEVLQSAWCGNPCSVSAGAHWYDTVFTLTYVTHFLAAPTIATLLYLTDRTQWVRWMRRYLTLCLCGLVAYVVYPMAPPWMASEEGLLHTHPARLTGRGVSDLGLHFSRLLTSQHADLVAAMPSLHVGTATLVAGFLIGRLKHHRRPLVRRLRWLLVAYPLLMTVTVVYFAEHYLLDSAAGALLAVVVLAACTRWERMASARRARRVVRRVEALQAEQQALRLAEFEEARAARELEAAEPPDVVRLPDIA